MTRTMKAGVVTAGVVGLLVLVAMAARGGHPGTNGHVATRAVPNSVQDGFITLLAIVYVAVIVAIVVGVFKYRERWHDPGSRWLSNFVLVCVLMAVATGIGYYAMAHSNLRQRGQQQAQQTADGSGKQQNRVGRVPATPAREAHFEWPLALGVVGVLVLGGVWIYVRGRRAALPAVHISLQADMVETIDATIDDLRAERDSRRAVIGAYAQMERTLRQHGLARRRAEAPFEYLGRILRELNVRDSAVRTLTGLFEYAKFSRHPVDDAMKEQAIEALLLVRDDLQAAAAEAA